MRRPRPSAISALLARNRPSPASALLFAFTDQAAQQPADIVLLGRLRLDPIADLLLFLAHMRHEGLNALGEVRHRRGALALILRIDGPTLTGRLVDDRHGLGLDV